MPKDRAAGEQYQAPVLTVSVAARLAGMHPQTLRQYDRLGIVVPQRTHGRGRRYSVRDVDLLREVQRLSQEEGVNLAGIKRILELTEHNERLVAEVQRLHAMSQGSRRVFTASRQGDVVALPLGRRSGRVERSRGSAVVVWRPER